MKSYVIGNLSESITFDKLVEGTIYQIVGVKENSNPVWIGDIVLYLGQPNIGLNEFTPVLAVISAKHTEGSYYAYKTAKTCLYTRVPSTAKITIHNE